MGDNARIQKDKHLRIKTDRLVSGPIAIFSSIYSVLDVRGSRCGDRVMTGDRRGMITGRMRIIIPM